MADLIVYRFPRDAFGIPSDENVVAHAGRPASSSVAAGPTGRLLGNQPLSAVATGEAQSLGTACYLNERGLFPLTNSSVAQRDEFQSSQRRDRGEARLPRGDVHGINNARGHPRLPREAAAERSRPRTRVGERTLCRHSPSPPLNKSWGLSDCPVRRWSSTCRHSAAAMTPPWSTAISTC